jgi:Phage integrase family
MLDRHAAAKTVANLARRAGVVKNITPHSLRHTFVTLALDAGAPLHVVQDDAGHADPRTTRRYDRARGRLDNAATYLIAAAVGGEDETGGDAPLNRLSNDRADSGPSSSATAAVSSPATPSSPPACESASGARRGGDSTGRYGAPKPSC